MADEDDSPPQTAHRQRLILSLLLGVLLLLVVITGVLAWLLLTGKSEAYKTLQKNLQRSQASLDFPLYYPVKMPETFVTKGSVNGDGDKAIVFSLTYNDDKMVIVTQQPRPPLMEEVKKIREFATPSGKAYIANLNGRRTGILLTDKTLVIVSSEHTVVSEDMEQLLRSLEPV